MKEERKAEGEEKFTCNLTTTLEGNTTGRKERVRGLIGVRMTEDRDGCTIDPPHDREYAVEPVDVAAMSLCCVVVRKMRVSIVSCGPCLILVVLA